MARSSFRGVVRRLGMLAVALCCAREARAEAGPVARFALVLGNNQARGLETLQFADDDAVSMHLLLSEAGVQSRLWVTLDAATRELHPEITPAGAPSARQLENEAQRLHEAVRAAAGRGERTELIVFFSGHGTVEGGEGQLLLEDGPFTRRALFELLTRSGAERNLVIVDACSSYYMAVAGKGGAPPRREPVPASLLPHLVPAELDNTGFILSSSSDRESHEWARFESGVLSYEVRSALRGGADVDLDGRITFSELDAFIARANESIAQRRLRPDPWLSPPGRRREQGWDEAVLVWSGPAAARVQPNATDHFFVENARGERLLDAHPADGQALELRLPSERPLFVRDDAERLEYELGDGSPALVAALEPAPEWPARKGARGLALRRLFALPFGLDDVAERRARVAARAGQGPGGSVAPVGREPAAARRASEPWQTALGYVAIGAGAAALGLGTLAFVTSLEGGDELSQASLERQNERVKVERALALGAAGVAAAAGGAWAVLRFGSGKTPAVALGVAPLGLAELGRAALGRGGPQLRVEGRF